MSKKAVLIDFDGTIVDSLKGIYKVFKAYFEMKGKPFISFKNFENSFKADWIKFLKEYGVSIEGSTSTNELIEQYIKVVSQAKVNPSMTEALRSFKELGFKVAVVSSSMEKAIESKLKNENIKVDLIVSGFESRISDKTELLKLALRKLKINPKDAVYVGDMREDMEAGKAIGVKVIGFARGLHDKEALKAARADSIVSDGRSLIKTVIQCLG